MRATDKHTAKMIAKAAVELADALIDELNDTPPNKSSSRDSAAAGES